MTRFDNNEYRDLLPHLIEVGSFRPDAATGLRGTIFFRTPDGPFPAPQWSDSPGVLLSGWINRYIKLLRAKDRCTQFDFMEGPYCIVAEAKSSALLLKFLDRGRANRKPAQIGAIKVSIGVFGSELLRAGKETLASAKDLDCTGSDVDMLHDRVIELSRELERGL